MKATAQTRRVARSDTQRFEALKREILHLNYFCKGTVLKRRMKCGNKRCPCHRDPGKRHGPYWECTYKVQNKTVNLKLYRETMPLYRAAIHQYRKLKSLLGRMERLSRSALAHAAQQKLTGTD
jgi:uncharacterized protein DUF6788